MMENSTTSNQRHSKPGVVVVSLTAATVITSSIMAVGFGLAILLAVLFNFKATTATHCKVVNYLPSISAAIAKPPSSYVWRFVITITAVQRFAAVRFHYLQYSKVASKRSMYPVLCRLCFLCELIEILALVGLTCISSNENTSMHENLFVTFQVCSMVFMLLMCIVYSWASGRLPGSSSKTLWERRSLQLKILTFLINLSCFLIAVYFYFRHNAYCEPGVYSLFAFFEYLVVLSNIGFHATVTYDFGDKLIMFGAAVEHEKQ
ncbi:post-GPI attachment to proteins factor 2-like [Amphiura filiformis]|uniref:post-GPI attachment to proteins factor 2-like n=1 Tax=Amphiura filiformis TaxID=82378 RepID=UPI003B218C02